MSKSIRVALVNQLLPHYREGVYRALDEDPRLSMTFAAGPEPYKGIRAIPGDRVSSFIALRNRFLGRVLWQSGVLPLVLKNAYDVYIFHGGVNTLSTWIAAIWLRLRKQPVMFWTIGWHRPEKGAKKMTRLIFYKLANKLLLYGWIGFDLGAAHGYPKDRMTVIYNSVLPSLGTAENSAETGSVDLEVGTAVTVGAVVRLNRVKRLDLLIGAVEVLRDEGHDVGILLVGEGDARDFLLRLAQERLVPIRAPGAIYSAEGLQRVYDRLSVTVLPTLAGLTVIQSMMHGVPVVTHDNSFEQVPEYEAVQHHLTGSLYSYGDLDSLTTEIKYWIENSGQECARRCREEVDRNWSPQAQKELIVAAVFDCVNSCDR